MGYSDRPQCIYEINLDEAIIHSDGIESCSECEIRKSELFIGEIIDLGYRSEKEDKVITLPPPNSIMTFSDAIPDRIIRKTTPMLISEKNGKESTMLEKMSAHSLSLPQMLPKVKGLFSDSPNF